jgi:hypothetical protein
VLVAMVTNVTSDLLVTMVILVTSITDVPIDTFATMVTKVPHVCWLLWFYVNIPDVIHSVDISCCP